MMNIFLWPWTSANALKKVIRKNIDLLTGKEAWTNKCNKLNGESIRALCQKFQTCMFHKLLRIYIS